MKHGLMGFVSQFFSFFFCLRRTVSAELKKFFRIVRSNWWVMKGDFDWGNLVHWARLDLGLALDAEVSISEERARELPAQEDGAHKRSEGSFF